LRRALLLLALAAAPASAQIESALLSKVTFNLVTPGGKSLAMGGAFTAIADDATAALANPAGLGLLSAFEAGVSGKRFDDVLGLVTARSTASGGLGAAYPAVTAVNSDLEGHTQSLEYAGVVIPVSSRVVAAVTYAENLRFRGDPGELGYGYIELRDNRSGSSTTRRDFLFEYREFGAVELRNRLLAFSAGVRVTERLRVGLGLSLNRASFHLEGDAGGAHRIVNRTFISPTQIDVRTETLEVRDFGGTQAGLIVGVHADLADGLTAGASFRTTHRTSGTLALGGDVPPVLQDQRERRFSFQVPRDATLGVAWRPAPGLTVAGELQWIGYGDTAREPLPVQSYRGLVGPFPGVFREDLLAELQSPDDVFVPRLGVEYVATLSKVRMAFRLGYHREPAHGVTANLVVRDAQGAPFDVTDPPFSESVRTVFDGGRADDRFSGGLGLTLARSLSIDLAFDVGRSSRQIAMSMFYRF